MASSEAGVALSGDDRAALRLETLTQTDIAACLALSDAAGWNQTADDWSLFIRHGHAIGFRDSGANRLVATAAALPYGGSAGWISMVLVADAWRHRGLASTLLDACVAHLRAAGIVPVLDATPAGAAVYRRLGFVAGFEIERWEWRPAALATRALAADEALRPAGSADLDAIAALDREASGLDRRFLLASFLTRSETRAWLTADGSGFVIARAGRRAMQIGPLVGRDENQATTLLATAFASSRAGSGRAVFLDLPRSHVAIATRLEAQGFVRQRPFVCMSLGAAQAPTLGTGSFVLAGPEFG